MPSSERVSAIKKGNPGATRREPSTDKESDVVTAPPARRVAFNDADLRYLRGALLALRDAHSASDVAAVSAADPRVRTLARRAHATQADDISAIRSILLGWGRHEGSPDKAGAETPVSLPATVAGDLRSLEGLEIDRRFIEILTAHAEASLASARTEMIEGFGGASRRLAEDTSRASWRELAAISFLSAAHDHDRAPTSPARIVRSATREW
jgi:uncharacterized protein (DUF305 family)